MSKAVSEDITRNIDREIADSETLSNERTFERIGEARERRIVGNRAIPAKCPNTVKSDYSTVYGVQVVPKARQIFRAEKLFRKQVK